MSRLLEVLYAAMSSSLPIRIFPYSWPSLQLQTLLNLEWNPSQTLKLKRVEDCRIGLCDARHDATM